MSDRRYEDADKEIPLFNRIGHDLKLAGVLFGGMGEFYLFLLSEHTNIELATSMNKGGFYPNVLTTTEWSNLLKRSDDPLIFMSDSTGTAKSWVRKLQFQISGDVQQKIFARDGFKCMYCQRIMGEVTLSVDHFLPLDLSGANDPSNYLSSCRKCNKRKGSMHPKEWCRKIGVEYQFYVNYLKEKNNA